MNMLSNIQFLLISLLQGLSQHFNTMHQLLNHNINKHVLLHALTLPPLNSEKDTIKIKLSLLSRTRKFDQIRQISSQLPNSPFVSLSENLQKAKKKSQEQKKKYEEDKVFQKLKQLDDLSRLQDPNFQEIDQGQQNIFKLAHILFEEGNYKKTIQILIQLQKQDLKSQLWFKVTWAKLYSQISSGIYNVKTLQSLKKKLQQVEAEELQNISKENKNNNTILQRLYAQKQQFLILSLFILFIKANDEDIEKFVDFCTSSQKGYFSILQLTCPQLLRYLIAGFALNKTLHNNRTFDLFKLVETINRKIVKHDDAFTKFLTKIQLDFDFEGAAASIEECRQLIRKDIFLVPHQQRIIQGLQFLYFKLVCKVYDSISLNQIAKLTGKDKESSQLWILGFIRSGDIDAKIDSVAQIVVNTVGRSNSAQKYSQFMPQIASLTNSLARAITIQ